MRFEWDPEKEIRNLRKHGVSFVEASTVLSGEEFGPVIGAVGVSVVARAPDEAEPERWDEQAQEEGCPEDEDHQREDGNYTGKKAL